MHLVSLKTGLGGLPGSEPWEKMTYPLSLSATFYMSEAVLFLVRKPKLALMCREWWSFDFYGFKMAEGGGGGSKGLLSCWKS